MSENRPVQVLAVCLGNICRSPTAEAALREAADEAGIELDVRSGATGAWHVGEPPDARMRAVAAAAGLHLDGTATQVSADDLAEADLVLAMDRRNLSELRRMAAAAGVDTPIRLFREFDPEATDQRPPGGGPGGLEVPDPYYGGEAGFREVVALSRRAARGVVEHVIAQLDAAPPPR